MVFAVLGEDAWLKAKLADNSASFGGLMAAVSASHAPPLVLPSKLLKKGAKGTSVLSISGSAAAGAGIGADLNDGGSWNHQWDRSAACSWNSAECKI
eukprot:CAMPEP_0173390386 /NCGR_PEP_ID=MMETSP1356-20130122/14689_1 /TAXON_ID=77927 ORGANISM="Hemiselmis virescens, Strain PCC157" /NCGR_SAMPLE_ID=MMETSP1356 /ASSEMBLY_ACC=CAM_ASM_000847 /LENGTH=96 /DNA_ID=CAMNT_0014347759 /DNA_START=32 /DNA_END=322 /DNA_ORIENTATION=-